MQRITIPNLLLNQSLLEKFAENGEKITKSHLNDKEKSIKFYSGDWQKWINLTSDENNIYDIILTSETIYNPSNQRKLLDCMYVKLKNDGIILLAAKAYYFGVGGDLRDFEKLIAEDKRFSYKTVWSTSNGVQREILELRKAKPDSYDRKLDHIIS